jgi:hypothetical protein
VDTLWAAKEFESLDLGDERRNARAAHLAARLLDQPASSLPRACQGWAETKAAYRLFDNEDIDPNAILEAHRDATLARIGETGDGRILVVHDTTTLTYTTHHAVKGMGPIGGPKQTGYFVHSAEAVSLQGVPLGLLVQLRLVRDAEKTAAPSQQEEPPEQRESYRWIDVLLECGRVLPSGVRPIHVADREADFYDFLATAIDQSLDVVVRARWDRTLDEEGNPHLRATVAATAPLGSLTVEIPRSDNHPSYQATLALHACQVRLRPPQDSEHRGRPALPIQVVMARQIDTPPPGEEPVVWWLLTTLAVAGMEAASEVLRWYTLRWRVERFHYTLKSGCGIEELQLQTFERQERALALYSVVAWRLQYITYLARSEPTLPASSCLSTDEINVLCASFRRDPAKPPLDLHTAVRWIAQLGGFLARRRDGEPGVKVLWTGLAALHLMVRGYELPRRE